MALAARDDHAARLARARAHRTRSGCATWPSATSRTSACSAIRVLQTVDITIVRGELVPVGEDQVAHLELSREIVRRFNRLYGEVLLEPQPLLSESPLIPGSDGRKMSKSLDNTIGVREDEAAVRATVRSFITDPQKLRKGDPGRPEICPVFALHRKFSPDDVDRSRRRAARASSAASTARRSLPTISSSGSPRSGNAEPAGSARRVSSARCWRPAPTRVRPIARSTLETVRDAMHLR